MSLHVIEGSWEEIKSHEAELVGRHLRVTIKSETPATHTTRPSNRSSGRPSALGKYAFVAGGSEEFAIEKQIEIEHEDRARE
jgi:hypothetical protein